jgi:hypothetical protein
VRRIFYAQNVKSSSAVKTRKKVAPNVKPAIGQFLRKVIKTLPGSSEKVLKRALLRNFLEESRLTVFGMPILNLFRIEQSPALCSCEFSRCIRGVNSRLVFTIKIWKTPTPGHL